MKTIPWLAIGLALTLLPRPAFGAADEAQSTRAKVGDQAPDFTCQKLSGDEFALSKQKGKVVVVTFFATWCGPCLMELPHLQKQVYEKYKDRKDFELIVIGREHKAAELEKFQEDKGFSLPMAPDPKREIYDKYAEKFIPRTFVVGKDGKVKLASMGYTEAGFRELLKTLENELGH
jgi:peroxiredoxin